MEAGFGSWGAQDRAQERQRWRVRGWQGFPSSAPPMPTEAGPGQETCYCVSSCPDTAFTDGEPKAQGASAGHPVPVLSSQGVDLGVDPWGSLT